MKLIFKMSQSEVGLTAESSRIGALTITDDWNYEALEALLEKISFGMRPGIWFEVEIEQRLFQHPCSTEPGIRRHSFRLETK